MAEDRIVLGDAAWQFGLSSFVLGHFFFLSVGLGLSIKWARVAKIFDPRIIIIIIIGIYLQDELENVLGGLECAKKLITFLKWFITCILCKPVT